ncbi:unnamed protein product [Diamesa serratosioi]
MTTKAQANEDEVVPKVGSNRKLADNILPMARICKIMRFSPEINMIATESSYLVCCATEHFIRYIATEAYKNAGEKGLNYKALANYIQNEEKMDFLQAIIPHKITVKKYRKETSRDKYSRQCHHKKFQNFKTNLSPLCLGNLMEACKQALEDRDWKQLYIFLTKAINFKGDQFRQQYLEYLFIAMENDTEIETSDLMDAFLAQCRGCKNDFERGQFLVNTYLMCDEAIDSDEEDKRKPSKLKPEEDLKDDLEELDETDIDWKEFGIDISKF